jgi:hypothetical protein
MDSAPARVQLYFRARQGRKHNNADALSRRPCREECTHCHKVEVRADVTQARTIAAVAAADWDPAALRTEQLNDQEIRPIMEEVEHLRPVHCYICAHCSV